jgi:hypothetical protein
VPTRIVRNFGILKGRPYRPIRLDQWMLPPGESSRIQAAIASAAGKATQARIIERKSSIERGNSCSR